jgi:heptosyltransferase-2
VWNLGKHLLIRSPNWLGDAILCMPAVAHVLKNKPKSTKISVLSPAKLGDVWRLLDGIDEIIPVGANLWQTALHLHEKRCTTSLIFPNSLRTGLEALLGGIPNRIGFHGHSRSWCLTKALNRFIPAEGFLHLTLDYLQLASEAVEVKAEDMNLPSIKKISDPSSKKEGYIVVCPGAEYGPAKRWPYFAEAVNQIASKYKLKVILLGAPKDEEICRETGSKLTVPFENHVGKTSLNDFISWLANARLILCNDSGAMHLATLLRTPAVAVFGSTEPKLTGPLSACVRVVREHVTCSPCFLRECPIDFRCMTRIQPERVIEEAELALTSA